MEGFKLLIREMNRYFNTADHLLYITYPLVKDNKLIITVMENLNLSLIRAMEAILYYDRLYKRISPYPENFNSKLDTFKSKCAPRYNFSRDQVIMIQNINELVEERKKSPVEFVRKDKFVICNETYSKMKTINVEKLKDYLNSSKPFIEKVNRVYLNAGRRY